MLPKNRNLKSASLMFITVFMALLSLFRTKLLTYYFGATEITDSFVIAWSIPVFFINLISGTLYLGLIPDFTKQFKKDVQGGYKVFWSTNNITIVVSIFLIIVLFIFSGILLKYFFNFSSSYQFLLARNQFIILLPTIIFMLLMTNFNSYFSINDRFFFPYLLQSFPLLFSIFGLFLNNYLHIYGLSIGITIGNFFGLFIMYFIFIRNNQISHYQRIIDFTHIKTQLYTIIGLIFSQAALQVVSIIDGIMASYLEKGTLSIFFYSMRFNEMLFQGCLLTFIITIYPILSKIIDEGKQLTEVYQNIIRKILILSSIIMTCLLVIGRDVIKLLFISRKFQDAEINSTWIMLSILSIGLFIMGWSAINQRMLILFENYHFLAILGIIQIFLKIAFNNYFIHRYQLYGIGISTLIVNVIWLVVSYIYIWNKHQLNLSQKEWLKLVKVSIIAFCIIILTGLFRHFLLMNVSLLLRITIMVVVIMFCYYIFFLKIEKIDLKILLHS
ncbi:MAG: lipid II flippase MurJ [Candidatus Marinimicrobia bacterium]|nr:lipid II flippase MurJ [Candidatus Neomarinimicrobiota bacterium]